MLEAAHSKEELKMEFAGNLLWSSFFLVNGIWNITLIKGSQSCANPIEINVSTVAALPGL